MKKIFLCWLLSALMLLTQSAKSQDSTTIQGLLQYIMQPLDKNQIGNGYLEEYGFPAISMATYNGTLSANNKKKLHCQQNNECLTASKNLHKTSLIFYNKRFAKRYPKTQRLLAICLQSNITSAAFYKQKTAKIIQLNTHAFNRWLTHYLSLFAIFRV